MNITSPLTLIFLSLILSFVPIILGVATSYLKTSIVLTMLRNAFGIQGLAITLLEAAISIVVASYVMAPVFNKVITNLEVQIDKGALEKVQSGKSAVDPKIKGYLNIASESIEPWREFLQKHSNETEINTLLSLEPIDDKKPQDSNPKKLGLKVLLPAFLLSEVKEATLMGIAILLPFVALDLIIANLLTGLGMSMVSPTVIALPLKLFFFVSSDGWLILTRSLIQSYT